MHLHLITKRLNDAVNLIAIPFTVPFVGLILNRRADFVEYRPLGG